MDRRPARSSRTFAPFIPLQPVSAFAIPWPGPSRAEMARRRRATRYAARPFDALAVFESVDPLAGVDPGNVWLVDAMQANPPSWVEAVVIVREVCTLLGPAQMPPMVADLVLTPCGHVRFPPGGVADHVEIMAAVGRLFDRLLGGQTCPLGVWAAREATREGARTFRTPAAFAAALTALAPAGASCLLAGYVSDTQRRLAAAASPAAHAPTPWFLRPR